MVAQVQRDVVFPGITNGNAMDLALGSAFSSPPPHLRISICPTPCPELRLRVGGVVSQAPTSSQVHLSRTLHFLLGRALLSLCLLEIALCHIFFPTHGLFVLGGSILLPLP